MEKSKTSVVCASCVIFYNMYNNLLQIRVLAQFENGTIKDSYLSVPKTTVERILASGGVPRFRLDPICYGGIMAKPRVWLRKTSGTGVFCSEIFTLDIEDDRTASGDVFCDNECEEKECNCAEKERDGKVKCDNKNAPKNNDGRTACFRCGTKTKEVDSGFSKYNVCPKCGV